MARQWSWFVLATALTSTPAYAAEPKLVSVEKIWDRAPHNAFTDLARWRGRWHCVFREGAGHAGDGDGTLRVLESVDGRAWESAATLAREGVDLRDPKLSVTPDDRLMIVAGGSIYRGAKLLDRRPQVASSGDGREWTPPRQVLGLGEHEWLWRVTWHDGMAYGISYKAAARSTQAAKDAARTGRVEPGPADWKLKLFVSGDGLNYDLITHLDVPVNPSESTLRFLADGEMIALVRRGTTGWIGSSRPPYTDWRWADVGRYVGGPNFIQLPDGSFWAGSRIRLDEPRTVLSRMTRDGLTPALTLPSGGDNSYPGLVWHDRRLWMSYYSSHEGKSSIYLATIEVPLDTDDDRSRSRPHAGESPPARPGVAGDRPAAPSRDRDEVPRAAPSP